ncbi:MarR family winged helix-turn-helix transcriptional regulator [Macrococcus sp. DPC7161]|uniref:MarR family winged helix-turn-helix transcriptional regulator n=1 Tax=Macrococcus sp. DPC7161 TaxID=2507060 RepID=UPI0013E98886|nr:MarR family transcriptional regulator [Macrococcus sp. DPC7161]
MDKDIKMIEFELRRLADITKNIGRQVLKEYDISETQFIAIQWINETEKMTIGDLALKMNLANSSTSELIDQLTQKGYCQREKDDKDKRKVILKLTNKSIELIEAVIQKRQIFLQNLLQKSDIDMQILKSQIHNLYINTDEGEDIE